MQYKLIQEVNLSVKKLLLQFAEEMADGRIAEVLVPTEDLIEIKKGKNH